MKKNFSLPLSMLFCAGIFTACNFTSGHDTRISIHDNPDTYRFSARYDPKNAAGVENFVEQKLAQNGLTIGNENNFDANVLLNDGTGMYIHLSPGSLKINLNRHDNSTASYLEVKQICEGVKNILAGKKI
jgi:hypothetical protein